MRKSINCSIGFNSRFKEWFLTCQHSKKNEPIFNEEAPAPKRLEFQKGGFIQKKWRKINGKRKKWEKDSTSQLLLTLETTIKDQNPLFGFEKLRNGKNKETSEDLRERILSQREESKGKDKASSNRADFQKKERRDLVWDYNKNTKRLIQPARKKYTQDWRRERSSRKYTFNLVKLEGNKEL